MTAILRQPAEIRPGRTGFRRLLHAEWTKFRTVRGWVIGMLVAAGVTVLVGVVGPLGSTLNCAGQNGRPCVADTRPLSPEGVAVSDQFYFVQRALTGNGGITARVTALTGLTPQDNAFAGVQPWSKTGLIIKNGTTPGSAYAAVMATGGNGVRMQYDYTHDIAGVPGAVSPSAPRWLRLTRSGDTVTGYDSTDGTHWTEIGTADLAGLPATVRIGLFTASPGQIVITDSFGGSGVDGGPSIATGVLDGVTVTGTASGAWTGGETGGGFGGSGGPPVGYQLDGGTFRVTGLGDIAPDVAGQGGRARTIENGLVGAFAGLIAVIVVATMFTTAEYRRGLIRTTFAASPRRGRVLAAKSLVIGTVAFVAGLVASAVSVVLVADINRAKGLYVYSVTTGTGVRVVVGTAALVAVTAVFALAVGTVLRRSAGAVTAVVVAMVLPYILAVSSVLPSGFADWLLRLTPAAAFAVEQSMPAYPQVTASYAPNAGYFPLAPWAGFAVLCGYTVAALAVAAVLLRRRDA